MPGFPIFASRRVRRTPFTERVESAPLSGYTVYNHMLLPATFSSLEDDYAHLKKYVQIWDVAAERQVEIKGPDAHKLATMMSARDLRKAVPGKCYYAPLTDANGGMLNDPIALCLAADRFWFSIADSDVLYWALGLAEGLGLNVEISEPDVSPLAIQGPLADQLMTAVFGAEVSQLKFFNFGYFDWRGHSLLIARSGWSKQGGFEIYLHDTALGLQLWDDIWQAGEPFSIRAGCPNLIERIEGGLLSFGNDMTRSDTPLECGLDKYCSLDSDVEFIVKSALLKQRDSGVTRSLAGLKIDGEPLRPVANTTPCRSGDTPCGYITSAVFSPDFDSNLAIAMLSHEISRDGQTIEAYLDGQWRQAVCTTLPF